MKQRYKEALIKMACTFGETSYAERLKVGALIYKNDSIIALGVNGTPPKWPTNICEEREYAGYFPNESESTTGFDKVWPFKCPETEGYYRLKTIPECRHAEVAALEKLWNSSETAKGAEMFVSHSPCKACAIKLVTAGISNVYYRHDYRSLEGVKYLVENGVDVRKVNIEEKKDVKL
jgi:dCMP deaminase